MTARRLPLVLAGLFLCFAVFVDSGTIQEIPSSPTRWLTDEAGFLSSSTVEELNRELESYERETGHQVIVYIGKTTGVVPIEEWAARAFEAWGVGRKGLDDGLVLFIMSEDRKVRIEVGYGLEGIVPDAIAARVIDDILPKLREGDPDGAVREAVSSLKERVSRGDAGELPEKEVADSDGLNFFEKILIGIVGLFVLYLLLTNPLLVLRILYVIMSSGGGFGGGGRGSGGGVFRGGGGRSGGGGATGSW